jgi:hypothetical protein
MPRRGPSRGPKPERLVVMAPRFAKSKRRLPVSAQLAVDEEVKKIIAVPLVGEPKTGALKGVRVVKFKIGPQQLLMAYQFDDKRNMLEMLDVAAHENFHRDLQRYLDAR